MYGCEGHTNWSGRDTYRQRFDATAKVSVNNDARSVAHRSSHAHAKDLYDCTKQNKQKTGQQATAKGFVQRFDWKQAIGE